MPAKKQPVQQTAAQTEAAKLDRLKKRREAFVKVCGARMAKAIKMIGLVGNCSSSNYLYNEEDVKKMNAAFSAIVGSTLSKFKPKSADDKASVETFQF